MFNHKNHARSRVAILSDAFSGILGDATRSALITDDEVKDLVWIDKQLEIKDDEENVQQEE